MLELQQYPEGIYAAEEKLVTLNCEYRELQSIVDGELLRLESTVLADKNLKNADSRRMALSMAKQNDTLYSQAYSKLEDVRSMRELQVCFVTRLKNEFAVAKLMYKV